ncbi:MAG: hypothetical protein COB04_00300 [Gammaproteobacteria bacterium]|nr:MAG: hypothetical protein COB04_00300 [Gammaproteobacteria bacterium]
MSQYLSNYQAGGWASKIGALASIRNDSIRVELPYTDMNLNSDGGVVHGGIISTILHDVGKLLSFKAFESVSRETIDTLDSQINFIKAAKETDLVASAEIIRQTKFLLFVRAFVHNSNGDAVAVGNFIYRVCGDELSRDLHCDDIKQRFSDGAIKTSPMAEMMNPSIKKRHSGLSIVAMDEGECIFRQEDLPEVRDEFGYMARGAELLMMDNAAVFGSFSVVPDARKAATVDLKVSFCDRAKDEAVLAYGVSLKQRGNIVHNQIYVVGAASEKLIAMGTMTFWS